MVSRSRVIFILLIIFPVIPVRVAYTATSLRVRPTNVNMGVVDANDYEAGYKENIEANRVVARDSNNAWKVMVRTNDSNMGVVGGYTKPISDFYWRATGNFATQITYTDITNYDVEAARGPKTNRRMDIFIDFRILLAWALDVPGDYSISLLYTLTTQ